jgi:hypothetical protein
MRSTGLPRQKGLGGLTRVIRARTRSVTVTRQIESKGSLDQQTTTSSSDHTEDIWLFEPRESVAQELAGEQFSGGLGGLAVADGTVDVQHDDRITHGGVEYEVDTVVGHPEDDDSDGTASPETDFWVIDMVRLS